MSAAESALREAAAAGDGARAKLQARARAIVLLMADDASDVDMDQGVELTRAIGRTVVAMANKGDGVKPSIVVFSAVSYAMGMLTSMGTEKAVAVEVIALIARGPQ